ncbi:MULTISPECIES: hypothetical protein, partial [unclassified Providencia]
NLLDLLPNIICLAASLQGALCSLTYFTSWLLFLFDQSIKVIVFGYHKKTTTLLILNKNI